MPDPNIKDLVVLPGQFAYVGDDSKGNMTVLVGPMQRSLGTTERPYFWNAQKGDFVPCTSGSPAMPFAKVPQGYYAILDNPAPDGKSLTPGQATAAIDMQMGRRIHIEGPQSFPLWPMQSVEIVRGHNLRTDQYVLVEVEDESQATKNAGRGITYRDAKPRLASRSVTTRPRPSCSTQPQPCRTATSGSASPRSSASGSS